MNQETLSKANTLDIQRKEAEQILQQLETPDALKYITFEFSGNGKVQMSALLKSDIANELFRRIKEDMRSMISIYKHELKQL